MVVIFLFTIHMSQRVPKVEKHLNTTNMPLLTQRSNRTFLRMNREQKGLANKFSQQNIQKQKLQLSQKKSSKAVFQTSKDLRLAVNLWCKNREIDIKQHGLFFEVECFNSTRHVGPLRQRHEP